MTTSLPCAQRSGSGAPAAAARGDRYKVLAAGVFGLILTFGPARFAYTPLLPLMQEQAGLGVAAAGWLASINYMGYLCGALLIAMISDRVHKDSLYRAGLLLAVASTALMGVTPSFTVWAISRFLAGLSGALGMLLGSGLVLSWLIRNHHRSELGVHFSGVGLSIVVSTGAVMAMNHWSWSWRDQWLGLTVLGATLALPAMMWMPRRGPATITNSAQEPPDAAPGALFLNVLMAAYFCAGVGYVVSATFIVAIVDQFASMKGHGTWVFLVLGLAAAPACVLWDLIAQRMGDINALLLAAVVQMVGILLPVLAPSLAPALVGAALFDAYVMGIVSLVLTMAGRYFPGRPARMMGRLTVAYGLAQVIAPAVTGALAAHQGSYQAGLYLAAAVMLAGIALLGAARQFETYRILAREE